MMTARLQSNVQRRAARILAGALERGNLRMVSAGAAMIAAANDFAPFH
jgi:hypothetical protein